MFRPTYALICCLILTVVVNCLVVQSVTISVSPSANATNIEAAIEESKSGDTIEVFGGVYNQRINLSKRLTLRGVSVHGEAPVLDAMGRDAAIFININGAVIEGFNFTNSTEAGIKVTSNNNTIENNNFYNNKNGIKLLQSANNSLLNNIIQNSILNGIIISNSTNNNIIGNNISYNLNGIKLIFSYGNNLSHNMISRNKNDGIDIEYSSNNSLSNNTVDNCMSLGINLENSKNNTLRFNRMFGNRYDFDGMDINSIEASNFAGGKPIYYLLNANGTVINASSKASTIYCINCVNITIEDQRLENNGIGIYLDNTSNSKVHKISLINNSKGIYLSRSNGNTIRIDNAHDNNYLIYAIFSRNNTISIDNFNSSRNRYPLFLDSFSKNNNTIKYIGYQESPMTQIHAPKRTLSNSSAKDF